MPDQTSIVRRFLLWWFSWPVNPYVSANVAQDFTACQDYLADLRAKGLRVSVNHLLAGAVARSLLDFPEANARIVGGRIRRQPHVGIAMPVDLVDRGSPNGQELSLVVLEKVDTLTLLDIAATSDRTVGNERNGMSDNRFIDVISKLAGVLPGAATEGVLETLHRGMRRKVVADRIYQIFPITTGLTNPGATFRLEDGQLFRGGALQIPERLIHVGTVWGVSAVQDEVIVVNDEPAIRPMLPLLFLFDHRLIDGVKASRLLMRFGRILADPAAEFGDDGRRPAQKSGR